MQPQNLIAVLLSRVYETPNGFETWGVKLCALMYAISSGLKMPLESGEPFLLLLRNLFGAPHTIWEHIHVEPTVLCGHCATPVPVHDAIYAEAAQMWACPTPCVTKENP